MKKKWIIVGVLSIAILAVFLKKRPFARKKDKLTSTTVERGVLVNKVSASGIIKADKEVNLKFETSGRLAWVGVKEGDFVNQWQTIAQLELKELQRNLEKYLRDYSKERWDFEQEKEDQNVTSDDLDKYTLTGEVRRLLEKNQFDLEKAVLDVELKDIALKYATLVTPIAGIVTSIDTPIAGVNITPATAVFTVSDPQSVYFSANIDEMDIGRVKLGQETKVILDSFEDEEFKSSVAQISFTSVKTSGGGTAFPIKIPLPENQDLKFKSGMNGDIEIVLEKKENVLFIPSSAIIEREEGRFVWLIENGKTKKKEVKIGLEIDEETEILEGLKEGDKIISKEISKIKEGEKIQ